MMLSVVENPLIFLLLVNVLLLVIGCFMEALAAMLILIPILSPAAASYGIVPLQSLHANGAAATVVGA